MILNGFHRKDRKDSWPRSLRRSATIRNMFITARAQRNGTKTTAIAKRISCTMMLSKLIIAAWPKSTSRYAKAHIIEANHIIPTRITASVTTRFGCKFKLDSTLFFDITPAVAETGSFQERSNVPVFRQPALVRCF